MTTFYIHVNGVPYAGVDPTAEERLDMGAGGWHEPNQGRADVLRWGGPPLAIEGHINLRSHLDRILRRARYGGLNLHDLNVSTYWPVPSAGAPRGEP